MKRSACGRPCQKESCPGTNIRLTKRLVFATYLAPCNRPLYEHVARECGATDFVVGADWRNLAAGEIDVAFVCSPPLVWLQGAVEAIAAPVLTDKRFGGRPLYCSDVIVPASSAATSFDDLAGGRWAVNESSSWSGYWVTLARVGDWSYFGEVVEAGFHQAAIRLVSKGRVDGAAIDCQVLDFELQEHPELKERVKVIDTFPPAPSQPVVVRRGLDERLKHELGERVRSLRGPLLERHGFRRFATAPDYSFAAAVVGGRRLSRAEPQWLQKP
jgi:phosphonate transport system substrate-binding protein